MSATVTVHNSLYQNCGRSKYTILLSQQATYANYKDIKIRDKYCEKVRMLFRQLELYSNNNLSSNESLSNKSSESLHSITDMIAV